MPEDAVNAPEQFNELFICVGYSIVHLYTLSVLHPISKHVLPFIKNLCVAPVGAECQNTRVGTAALLATPISQG